MSNNRMEGRIRKLLQPRGVQATIAEQLGMHPSKLSRVLSNESALTFSELCAILDALPAELAPTQGGRWVPHQELAALTHLAHAHLGQACARYAVHEQATPAVPAQEEEGQVRKSAHRPALAVVGGTEA